MEMNPHYLADERATAAATALSRGKGASPPIVYRVGLDREGREERNMHNEF